MNTRYFIAIIISVLIFSVSTAYSKDMGDMGTSSQWQEKFDLTKCKLSTTGKNKYLILEPGHQLILEGEDEKLQITVLDETKLVDGITTRVVEEREWNDGEL